MRRETENTRDEITDDGRTIADMSDVPHGMLSGLWHPSMDGRQRHRSASWSEERETAKKQPWEDAPISRKERFWYMFGALKAALLIGFAYLAGLALLIGLMLLVWK
jgi:hypothetical protein